MYALWNKEYSANCEFSWDEIVPLLKEAVGAVEVLKINMGGDVLDYDRAPTTGRHVIAIGGLALARGLTLEGLCVSYVLRNVSAADTLLQIGRWFGYRLGYKEYCRVYLTEKLESDFSSINESVEELRDELKTMEQLKMTPLEFGLKVRRSETGIAITAKNKMRSAERISLAQDFGLRHVQGFEAFNSQSVNKSNLDSCMGFIEEVEKENQLFPPLKGQSALVWTGVDVLKVLELLKNFENPALAFRKMKNGNSLLMDYLRDRSKFELATWTVAVPYVSRRLKKSIPLPVGGAEGRFCRTRHSAFLNSATGENILSFTRKNNVSNPVPEDLKFGEDQSDLLAGYEDQKGGSETPRWLKARRSPFLIVHLLDVELEKISPKGPLPFDEGEPVVTLSVGLPSSSIKIVEREYEATTTYLKILREMMKQSETDEDIADE